jgi:hypothetical protein
MEEKMSKVKIKVEEGTYASIRYDDAHMPRVIKVSNRNVRDAIKMAKMKWERPIISLHFYDEVKAEMPYCHKGKQMVLKDHFISNKSRIYYPDAKLLTAEQVKTVSSWIFRETEIEGKRSVLELPFSPHPACRPLLICSKPKIYKGYISVGDEAHMCPSASIGGCFP